MRDIDDVVRITELREIVDTKPHWRLEDIDFDAIDRPAIAEDTLAFRIVFLASLVEAGSDLYASNLIEYFGGDPELSGWLRESWEPEEVQHSSALRTYVERVWPEIDWRRTYNGFFAAYSRTCTVGALEPTPALELAARCMVETGTAALYGALQDYAREPVLRDLAGRIFADEVRHYKHFYRHFLRYQMSEQLSRWRIGRTLASRLIETRTGDAFYAYRELRVASGYGGAGSLDTDYRAFVRSFASFIRNHAPRDMHVRMGLRPLQLPARVESWITRHSGPVYALWTGLS